MSLGKWFPDYYELCEYFKVDIDSQNDYDKAWSNDISSA